MPYEYLLKRGEIRSGYAFHSFSRSIYKKPSLENPAYLGNFYHIN